MNQQNNGYFNPRELNLEQTIKEQLTAVRNFNGNLQFMPLLVELPDELNSDHNCFLLFIKEFVNDLRQCNRSPQITWLRIQRYPTSTVKYLLFVSIINSQLYKRNLKLVNDADAILKKTLGFSFEFIPLVQITGRNSNGYPLKNGIEIWGGDEGDKYFNECLYTIRELIKQHHTVYCHHPSLLLGTI